ncbi:protocadherin Fat 4-like [Rhinophrynus dorsalis]
MACDLVLCQLHYIIPEESKHGTFIGRIALDLGLEISEINSRMLRIVSSDQKEYFQVNLQNGILFVKDKIDREELCPDIPLCVVSIQVIVDKPVQMYYVDVEIEDINDNYPVFYANEYSISIAESSLPGYRFPLDGAVDADIGTNSITNYELTANDYFILEFPKYIHQIRSIDLVLKKSFNREKISYYNLTLMAFDGGKPKLSGSTQVIINVEDANDNTPIFNQSFYQCSVTENAVKGTLVIKLNATDLDQGKNAEISYKFSRLVPMQVLSLFSLDMYTGEIRVKGELDYETSKMYELHIDAVDNGDLPLTGRCKVLVTVLDVNDNLPEMTVTSLSVPVPEDSRQGTIVAIISVRDKDSGLNGRVNCYISEPTPFKINPTLKGDFSLTVNAPLDREIKSEYEIEITAKDEGSPSLSVSMAVKLEISDVNDNSPQFLQPVDTIFIKENNPPGSLVYTVSASDVDINQNSFITYSLIDTTVDGIPISSYMSINPENGNLYSLLSFDHEQIAYFQCRVIATDAGLPPLSSNLTLNIFIIDTNDNAPAFSSDFGNSGSAVKIKIPKSVQSGHLVTKVSAVDMDSGYNAWMSYKFKDSSENSPFGISQYAGEIRLIRPFTESENDEFKLFVLAQDHGEPSMTAVMQIVISLVESGEDIKLYPHSSNDNEDEFSNANVYLIISICSVSSIFLITLIVFTVLKWQKYRAEVNQLRENYKICSNTGGSWIFSQQSQYKFYVNSLQAKNDLMVFSPNYLQSAGKEGKSTQLGPTTNSSGQVDVEIEDINDNPPVFSVNEYTISIAESRMPGSRFPLEGAVDPDVGTNSITNYELNANDYFILEFPKYIHQIRSIELILKKSLDREKISVHNLTLMAFDGGKPKLSGSTQLIINVEDANDNTPMFSQPFYECKVVENALKETLVIKLNATDLDQGKNGEISYEFNKLVSQQILSIFSLDKYTGEIRVKGELDYENSKVYEIQVDAIDNGELPLTGHCKVLVTILDVNDNPPEMTVTSLSVPVPEDTPHGTTVAIISVHDKDSGANGKVNCYISEPTLFKISPAYTRDFALIVNSPLDRETKSVHEIVITAEDEGSPSLSVSKTLKVEVSDVNDNNPQFLQPLDTIFIKENNPPGSLVYIVSASDLDINQNAYITYSLSDNTVDGIPISSYMSINPENGNLYSLLSFDHEQIAYFQCQIKATDAGLPPLSSNLTLNVFIVDINDNSPTFSLLPYNSGSKVSITTLKSVQPGHLLTKVRAVDLDSGYNAWVSYKFKDTTENSLFSISQHTEEISLKRPFTDSDDDEYSFFVVAQDHGEPTLTTMIQIVISLVDSGEEIKLELKSSSVNEDEFSNANFFLVIAICLMSCIFLITIIVFSLLKWQKYRDEVNHLRENYKICSNTGGSWIYSQQSQYKFYVNSLQARNDLLVFTPNSLQFSGKEVNSTQPETIKNSSGELYYIIPEESKHGTFVGRIAQDLGLEIREINSRMLRIVSGDQNEYFQVNLQNGILFVKDKIDRENLCPNVHLCIISVQVIFDKPIQMYQVDVEIEDINDNHPVFSANEYSLSIAESRLPGYRFPLDGAVDADIGTNSITNYELTANDYFTLEFPKYIHQIRSLELVLKKSLDREKISVHNLTLMAFDGGKPKLSGSTQLIINVEDTNDNAPIFNQSFYQCNVVENAVKGTLVIKLNATDLDQGKNGEISYAFNKLVPMHIKSIFSLDKNTGEIRVKGELDYESSNVYEIHVDAFDNDEPPLTGHCKVLVTVLDVNDNPPEMTVTSLSVPVPEDSPQGTIVAILSVHDRDSGFNGRVNCYIYEPTPFKISSAYAGVFSMTVKAPLDRETKSEYVVIIFAKDEGSPALSISKIIKIEVSDVNDNAPQFLQPIDTIFIKENNPPGSLVYTVSASDSDMSQNSFITYSLSDTTVDGTPISSYLSINPENGNLFSLLSFDHEQIGYFQCYIKATDAGLPPLSSNLTLNIFIVDINDNAPTFSLDYSNSGSTVKVTIPKSEQLGYVVTKVRAVDLDSGYNAWMSYRFKDMSANPLFVIAQYTGEIRLIRSFTESDNDEYILFIQAQDHGEPAMTAVTQIIISVVESGGDMQLERQHFSDNVDTLSYANIYLVISICLISSIFLITLLVFTVLRWQKYREEINQLKENYKFCSNSGGSWIYSQQSQYKFYVNSLQAKNELMVFASNHTQSPGKEGNSTPIGTIMNSTGEKMLEIRKNNQLKIQVIYFFLLQMACDLVLCQLHYIISEESKHGTFIGRIAQDLGLEISEINSRMLRIISRDKKEYFQVNLQNGILFVKDNIDREQVCSDIPLCIVSVQVIVDKPVQMYRVDVEIEDINDNHPVFPANEYSISIVESRLPGFRLPLEGAVDPDVGTNSITNYELSTNDYFILEFPKYIHQIRSLELVLKKSLDREKIPVHNLTLMAFDGGKPKLSGSTQLIINVEDANDNSPTFNQSFYQCNVDENAFTGTLVIKLNATDLDQGKNGEISYQFNKLVQMQVLSLFHLDKYTGEIRVKGELDYESINVFEIYVDAFDNGDPPLTGHCKVVVAIRDVNDNPPEMTVTSLSVPVPEDAPQGTTIAIISVHDRDSGTNGKVNCYISGSTIFKIIPAYTGDFSLTVNAPLDRENKSEYEVVIIAKDEGSPPLSVSKTIKVELSDVNDNAPQFLQPIDTIFIKENNPPGSLVYTVSASDSDINQNSFITYSLSDSTVDGTPISSYMSINPENGNLYSLLSFDHEQIAYFQCHAKATDSGLPPLSSNLTLNIFIVDINDNAPSFSPVYSNSGSALQVTVSKSAQPGLLVTKVIAVDLDSGYNAWMSYRFKDLGTNPPFGIAEHTGEIRLIRPFTETDSDEFRLFVMAQDHGEPSMTAVMQTVISLVESEEAIMLDLQQSKGNINDFPDTNIYLIVSICSISSIFLITLIVFTVLRWQKYRDEVIQLRENYRICSNTGGSWIYSQQSQYKFYVNSIQAKKDLMIFAPNCAENSGGDGNSSQPQTTMNTSGEQKLNNKYHNEWKNVIQIFIIDEGQQLNDVPETKAVPEGLVEEEKAAIKSIKNGKAAGPANHKGADIYFSSLLHHYVL